MAFDERIKSVVCGLFDQLWMQFAFALGNNDSSGCVTYDIGDVMLDVVKRFTQEIGGEQGKTLLDKFLEGYDIESQNVLQYRYDI